MVDINEQTTQEPTVETNYNNQPTDPETRDLIRYKSDDTQQEAIKVIDRAKHYEMHPDQYGEMKTELDPEAELEERIPDSVNNSVRAYASQSSRHASVVENEVGALDYLGKQASFMSYNLVGKRKLENEIEDLQVRKLDQGELPEHEESYLTNLLKERDEKVASFGLEGYAQAPGQALGVVGDMFEAVGDNKLLISAATGAGALIGGFTGGPGGFAAGAGTGLLRVGIPAALAFDAYTRISSSTFDELGRMSGDDGRPLNLPTNTKQNIAIGVGLASGALEGALGFGIGKGFQRLAGKKALQGIVSNTSLRTSLEVLGNVAKTAAGGGIEETASELVAILGENYARGHQSEAGFLNALYQTVDDVFNDPATQERLKQTAFVGALAGGGIAAATGTAASRKIKKTFELSNEQIRKQNLQNETVKAAIKALDNQDEVIKMSNMSMETDLKRISPDQMSDFRRIAFDEAGYFDKIFFNEEDIVTIGKNNPEIAEQLRTMDVTESSDSDTASGVAIKPHQFLDLVDDAPTVSEYARLNPEAPNPLESKNLLERFNEAQTQRQEILESLGPEEELSPEQVQTMLDLDATVDESVNNAGIQGYVEDAVTFTEGIEGVTPDKQVESFNKAQRKARQNVADQMIAEFEAKEQLIENKVVKLNEKIEKEAQAKKVANDLRIVEHFTPVKGTPKIEAHKKAGHSPLAIDPKFLPDDLREAYLSDPKLRKRKVFVEGGITPEESAALAGVKDPETMLKILANAPTKAELIAERKTKSAAVRKQVKESRAENVEARRNKVFDDINKLHLKEINFMKSEEWLATKQGVKKIVLPSPKIEELNNTARVVVNKTKVGDLNPRQFNAAEKNLQRKSANHILENEVEAAFVTKEKAMLNTELTRESLKARDSIAKAKETIKNITSKSGLNTLKKAGMLSKVTEVTELFDLLGTEPKGVKRDSYFEYLRTLDDKGRSITVPQDLADVREVGTELTVEQYLRVTDRLKTLTHQAKLKNKLLKKSAARDKAAMVQTVEAVSTDAALDLKENHPNYSEARLKKTKNKNSKSWLQIKQEQVGTLVAMQTNFKNIILELDQEEFRGKNYDNVGRPMVEAETFKRDRNFNTVEHITEIIDNYGEAEFGKAFNEFIDIPEFEGYEHLGNGRMAKADLWYLLAYMGDPHTKGQMENFTHFETGEPMSVETVQNVLDRVLTSKDANLAQNFVNIYKSFTQEAKDLHERTTGVSPTMVKGVPIIHKGKVMDGGYVPANHHDTDPTDVAARFLEVLGDEKNSMFGDSKQDDKLRGTLRAAEMTDQARLMDRTGSKKPLDTDFRNLIFGFEEHVHDLAYREAGIDTLKLLRNKDYSDSIVATVGQAKYRTMVSAVIETVGEVSTEDTLSPFRKEMSFALKIQKIAEQNFAVSAIGFKAGSVGVQPLSLGAAALRMGPTGGVYLTKSIGNWMKAISTGNYGDMRAEAIRINPDIKFNIDSVDDSIVRSTTGGLVPETVNIKGADKFAMLRAARQKFVDASFWTLKQADIQIKMVTTNAAYGQFIDGNVKNFPQSRLDTMTDAQIDTEAKAYAKQVADAALTTSATIDKSAAEKIANLRLVSRFYTDVRAQLNTSYSALRKVRLAGQRATGAFKAGDVKGGLGHVGEGAGVAGYFVAISAMMEAYEGLIRGEKDNPIKELVSIKSPRDLKNFVGNTAKFILKAPAKAVVGQTLIGRDVKFALGGRNKQVNFPLNRIFSDATMGITGLADMIMLNGLSKKQKKGMLYSASYILGLPVRGPQGIMNMVEESGAVGDVGGFVRGQTNRLADAIGLYAENNPNDTEMIEHLKGIQEELVPALEQDVTTLIPEDSMEVLKLNEWDDLNPVNGAAGIYQFTEDRWNEISEEEPDLGLTDNGRVSQDTREQEKAMKWELERNTQGLIAYQIEVNNANLFGAHRFGLDDFVAVMVSDTRDKLTNVVDDMTLFEGFKSVGQVRKYVKREVGKEK